MIHLDLDQLEFFPIFPYSGLLFWMLPVPNVTDHSYFDRVYLKVFTAKDLCLLPMYCRLEDLFFFFFFDVKKNPQVCNTWIYRELGPT